MAAGAPSALVRLRGPALALVVALAGVLFQYERHRDLVSQFTRFDLPAFDPYVYVAMAEQPSYFTVAPWGYRILAPWLVHALPSRSPVRGFRMLTLASLAAAGLLLFFFLRRVGHGEWASLLAVGAFELSGPVSECMESLFVNEPLCVALFLAFLLAVEARAHVAVPALLAVLLAFSKELWVVVLPLVYLVHRGEAQDGKGRFRALAATAAVGLPALVASQSLRLWWVPHIHPPRAPLNLHSLQVALDALRAHWSATWPALLLAGLTPAAAIGAFLPRARRFSRRYGYLALAMIALALVAWINIPAPTAIPLYGSNTMRLMVYALPLLFPLALFALDGVLREWRPPSAPRQLPRAVGWVAAGLVVAAVAFPFVMLDRYRRLPLHHYREGRLVVTLCRESLKTARRLERGRETSWSLAGPPIPVSREEMPDLSRLRWYLREGWGSLAWDSSGEAVSESPAAALLLPCFASGDVEVTLDVVAPTTRPLSVRVNGQPVAQAMAGPTGDPLRFRIPVSLLFRGDNLLTLSSEPGLRLRALSYRPLA